MQLALHFLSTLLAGWEMVETGAVASDQELQPHVRMGRINLNPWKTLPPTSCWLHHRGLNLHLIHCTLGVPSLQQWLSTLTIHCLLTRIHRRPYITVVTSTAVSLESLLLDLPAV